MAQFELINIMATVVGMATVTIGAKCKSDYSVNKQDGLCAQSAQLFEHLVCECVLLFFSSFKLLYFITIIFFPFC